ncbi:MAG: hypothetical protein ABFD49_03160 [Armatimonadota bacterium]|nr:hypothetical protein [bacterium]
MVKRGLRVMWVLLLMLPVSVAWAQADQDAAGTDIAVTSATSQLAKPSEPGKPYTSVIIDTSGFDLQRSMSPKIRRADGTEVWGTVKVDYDFLEDHGMVSYASSLENAMKSDRCGANPMTIKAVGIAEKKPASDPMIANEDATLLIEENSKGKFLDKFNVIFVKCAQPTPMLTASK